jgi:hypothetical protein
MSITTIQTRPRELQAKAKGRPELLALIRYFAAGGRLKCYKVEESAFRLSGRALPGWDRFPYPIVKNEKAVRPAWDWLRHHGTAWFETEDDFETLVITPA